MTGDRTQKVHRLRSILEKGKKARCSVKSVGRMRRDYQTGSIVQRCETKDFRDEMRNVSRGHEEESGCARRYDVKRTRGSDEARLPY